MELWEEDLYELIGVDPEASPEEIKKAYKKLAITLHPDRFPNDEEKRVEAQAQFGKITNAYNILKDEEERAEYDFARRMGFASGSGPAAPAGASAASTASTGGTGKMTSEEESVSEAKRSQAQNQFDQGKVYHKGKNFQKAIACYKEAVRLNPSVADYHAHLGMAYFQQGLKTPANNSFAAAYKLDKKNKVLAQYYTPPGGGKGSAKGDNGKKGGASEKPGLLDQLKALFSGGGAKDAKAGAKKGAPAKKGTAPLKKAGAKK